MECLCSLSQHPHSEIELVLMVLGLVPSHVIGDVLWLARGTTDRGLDIPHALELGALELGTIRGETWMARGWVG